MDDEDYFKLIILGTTFFLGFIILLSGLADVSLAINPNTWFSDVLNALRASGTGALKVIVGIILIGYVVAPNAVKVILSR